MTAEERDQMNVLCLRIQEEKDFRRFQGLLRDLNELIGQKELRCPQHDTAATRQPSRPWKTVSGSAQKIVSNIHPGQSESVEIAIDGAEHLFREIRLENSFTALDGQPVALKQGARVDVTFEADAKDTVKKASASDKHA